MKNKGIDLKRAIGMCASAALAAGLVSPCRAADVYVSPSADGTPVYSTRSLGPSSTLLLKGEDGGAKGVNRRAPVENLDMQNRRQTLEPLIRDVATRNGIDPALVRAIAHVESRFNTQAISPAGAQGIMQLMPATAKRYGTTNRRDPLQNLEAGARYFKDLLTRYQGNVALALAAYNSGETNIERHANRIPPFRETMLYVPEVLTRYESYRQAEADASLK